MARIGIELSGDMVAMIDRQAEHDGHDNRSAVIRKALNAFFAGSPNGGGHVAGEAIAATDGESPKSVTCGIELSDEMIELIDRQARQDGHSNRSAVVRKALVYFFAR